MLNEFTNAQRAEVLVQALPNIKKYSDDLKIETEIGVGTTLKITINC